MGGTRRCFVPGCTSGYQSNPGKFSMFHPPKDSQYLEIWKRNIPRADKDLDDKCVVCELHFDIQYIEKFYKHRINGKEVTLPRGKPILTQDAVPTNFPNLPKHLNKPVPKKRTSRTRPDPPATPAKRKRPCKKENGPPLFPSICNSNFQPSIFWCKQFFQDTPNAVAFTVSKLCGNDIKIQKLLLISELPIPTHVRIDISLHGRKKESFQISSLTQFEEQLKRLDSLLLCQGAANIDEFKNTKPTKSFVDGNTIFNLRCKGTSSPMSKSCVFCKYTRKILMNQKYRHRNKESKKVKTSTAIRRKNSVIRYQKMKIKRQKNQILEIQKANDKISREEVKKAIKKLPHKQQLAVMACLEASRKKSLKAMRYNPEWLLECIIMKMKSARLYQHIRKHKILILPSKNTITRVLKKYRSGFGFNQKIFDAIKQKVKCFPEYSLHGGIVIDEMKLSEKFNVNCIGEVEGFVDLGKFTPEKDAGKICNHGLVFLFQPFCGEWKQIVAVFGTSNNVNGELLSKLITEAIILIENSGLFVDFITCDGATWNRTMWRKFGVGYKTQKICQTEGAKEKVGKKDVKEKVKKKAAKEKAGNTSKKVETEETVEKKNKDKQKKFVKRDLSFCVPHPVRPKDKLCFLSDFPHLVKCLRNSFIGSGFCTPDGEVKIDYIECAWKQDRDQVTLKAMPKLTASHLHPDNFEKMRVNLAFQLFGSEVIKGLYFYKDRIYAEIDEPDPTIHFIEKMKNLIAAMTSRFPDEALRLSSVEYNVLNDFLNFLDVWEASSIREGWGYVSKSTSLGFRVTLRSTLFLLEYLSKNFQYEYLMTSRLSQDALENLFGIVRESKGSNDHPTPTEFLVIIESLSFYNLARPPKNSNVAPNVISALLSPQDKKEKENNKKALVDLIDQCVDMGNLSTANDILEENAALLDHRYTTKLSDQRLTFYTAGYVARKFRTLCHCKDCSEQLFGTPRSNSAASFMKEIDNGGLTYPSDCLFRFVNTLENTFTEYLSGHKLEKNSMLDILNMVKNSNIAKIGCHKHSSDLTKKILKFYILTRMHFYVKSINKDKKDTKAKLLKLRRLQ